MAYHGISALFSTIDFLCSNIIYRRWHLFLIFIYPISYCLWVQLVMETHMTDTWPYPVVDYYAQPWFATILLMFGLVFAYAVVFLAYCIVCKIRTRILCRILVGRRDVDWELGEAKKRKGMEEVVAESVRTATNVAVVMVMGSGKESPSSVSERSTTSLSTFSSSSSGTSLFIAESPHLSHLRISKSIITSKV